jgi:hypothetical protein
VASPVIRVDQYIVRDIAEQDSPAPVDDPAIDADGGAAGWRLRPTLAFIGRAQYGTLPPIDRQSTIDLGRHRLQGRPMLRPVMFKMLE